VLHAQLTAAFGTDWYQNGGPNFTADSQSMIGDAFASLVNKPLPLDPNDVVAELKFAFWVGLLGPHYDATLWRHCLHKAFLARGGRPRKTVHGRLNTIRRFRNRVMHHEPIFNRPLQQLHDEIIEAISWMCRDTAAWTTYRSRYDEVAASQGN